MLKLKTQNSQKSDKTQSKSNPQPDPKISEDQMMCLFLDALVEDAFQNPSSLVVYTEEMAKRMDERLAGVVLD